MTAAAEPEGRAGTASREASTASVAVEDYVRAVLHTARGPGEVASTTAVAAFLAVTPASVSGMFKKLARLELVVYEPYRGVRLTREGRRLALRVTRRHRLLEAFLGDVLGMPRDHAHAEADRLEHHISRDLEELLSAHLGASGAAPGPARGAVDGRSWRTGTAGSPRGG